MRFERALVQRYVLPIGCQVPGNLVPAAAALACVFELVAGIRESLFRGGKCHRRLSPLYFLNASTKVAA